MVNILPLLKAASDETRLRILRLLLVEPRLNVGELQAILGIAQSSVSRHLGELRKAGLVAERRAAGFAYYESAARDGALLAALRAELREVPDRHGDEARLAEVRRRRADRGEGTRKHLEPGRSWVAWARALRHLLPPLEVADFGCGDGALTAEVAAWARSVVAIDRDGEVLARARERLGRAGVRNVSLLQAELAELDLPARTFDLVLVSHALHHVEEPGPILAQAHRVLRPAGRVLVLELAPHGEEWVREKLGHVWLGFPARTLETALVQAGFHDVQVETSPRGSAPCAPEPFRILIATATRGLSRKAPSLPPPSKGSTKS